jgi:hypothetical protein
MKTSELYSANATLKLISATDLFFALAHKKTNPLAIKEGISIGEQMLYASRRGHTEDEAVEHIADALIRYHWIKPEFHEDVATGIGKAIVKALHLGQDIGDYLNAAEVEQEALK